VFKKKKRRLKKTPSVIPQTGERMTTGEKAYLDRLERLIASPDASPYIVRHKKPEAEKPEPPGRTPIYDSGPMSADQLTIPDTGGPSGRVAPEPRAPAVTIGGDNVRLGADGVYELCIDVPRADIERQERRRPMPPTPPPQRPAARQKRPAPPPAAVPMQRPTPQPPPREEPPHKEPAAPKSMFPPGTLVLWNNTHLGIYKEYVAEKEYDLVYVVEPDGRLQPKGICLFAYEPQRVGLLSDGIFRWMESTMRWERDALVCHFDDPELARTLLARAEPSEPTEPREEAGRRSPQPKESSPWVRGRTFTIKVGKHQWVAVYWARDEIGAVVAHNTNRQWSLMHLDLDRFGPSVLLGDVLPDEQVLQIEKELQEQEAKQ